jgi:hypothetical protein
VTVAGVDLSKWDKRQLHKRVGVLLNDARTSDRLCIIDGGMYFGGNFGAGGAAGGRWRENRSEGTEFGCCCHEGE